MKVKLLILSIFLATAAAARAQPAKTALKFYFADGAAPAGFNAVPRSTDYSDAVGYGFERGRANPAYFSVKLPEGNYTCTVALGDASHDATTTIKAELRRLMLEKIHTSAGQTVTQSFTVNIRTPAISTGDHVHLKPREQTEEFVDWDNKLTLEFNGEPAAVQSLEIAPADVPTVYILGDSTVCDQPREPWNSWGQMLPRFFDAGVAISNQAESGESLRSSLHANRLAKVLSTMKRGDYIFIQYGHNDMKEKGAGVGAFTTYKSDLKHFADSAKEKGATVVLVTSMERKAGVKHDTLGDYPAAVRALAKEENLPLIDLHEISRAFYRALGSDIGKAFQDGTHHNNYGSYELAKCIIEGIRGDHLPLEKFIRDDVGEFDPAHPDPVARFSMPASAESSTAKPEGN
jgi:lysophospholipase L1-like esterase